MSFTVFIAAIFFALASTSRADHLHDHVHDRAHMGHHVGNLADVDKMSEEELRFNYFKAHDVEGNGKLDGCELVQALLHYHEDQDGGHGEDAKVFTDEELSMLIDPIFQHDDKNMDGFIDYPEYVSAHNRMSHSG